MIKFLMKGLLRDKSRSILPLIVVSLGALLTVFFSGYIKGAIEGMIEQSARFDTGHVKIVTNAYADEISQKPLDLAILEASTLQEKLEKQFPAMTFAQRIQFGGMLDVPDAQGVSRAQGIGSAIAIDLRPQSGELKRLNIRNAIQQGDLPQNPFEILMGAGMMERLKLKIGEEITFFGATMDGGMAFQNLRLAGTVEFGNAVMDNQTFIIHLPDAQQILDMKDGCAEIVGYLPQEHFDLAQSLSTQKAFNQLQEAGEFEPTMLALSDQNGMDVILAMVENYTGILTFIFILAISVVLWNTGLLGGLRRYQEFGIRIAMGETKKSIYKSLIAEAILIGFTGATIGSILGIAGVIYLQENGLDIAPYLEGNQSMMIPNVLHARFTPSLLYIGFIPGLCATVLGAILSGRGIFKRQTAELFNELGV
ncbi:ABC transporter permease [Persicobacter diffluens]|uniref:ABC3 transporter permease C-terminal domain-containing protein n=1 Tax=Persicobacter diffluens TaxID=981 RepID=A0AAN4VZA8_9BACT|nr:hypothetical protein PEDI_33630 [Persicobacter diffluens]